MTGIGSTLPRAGPWSRLNGVFITVALIGLIEFLSRFVSPVPTPVGIGTLGVVYAALAGGTWPGMASAALLALYGAYRFSLPGTFFQFDGIGLWRLSVAVVVPPTIVLVVSGLRRRSEQAFDALRRESILKTQIEERSRIGRDLKRERYEQQTIFHSVPAMIWFKDANNRILRANRLAAESIGRTVEEVEGRLTAELYPNEAAKYQQDDLEVIQSGKPKLGIIERYEILGGEDLWVRTDKIPYYDASGRIVGVIVFAVDITEQKKAQQSLQDAHDELDRRVHARTAELTEANARLRREIGDREQAQQVISERALLAQFTADVGVALTRGKDLRDMLQECCEAMVRRMDAALARIWVLDDSGQTLVLQGSAGLYTHIDGGHSRIPIGKLKVGLIAQERKPHLTNNVLGDSRIGDPEWARREGLVAFVGYPLLIGEKVIGVMALFARKPLSVLVTEAMGAVADTMALGVERHLTEEQRRLSDERLQQVLDNSTAVMYVKDGEGRYVLINRRFEELFHITREKIKGKTDYDVFPRDTADEFRSNDRKVLESGSEVEFEEVVPHDDGPHTYISLKFPLYNSARRPMAVCGISTDITERKKTEALLRDHASALEAANQALAAAREAAEAANRAKSRFLANISHEIRTPIMAMLGAAELLQSDERGRLDHVDRGNMILRNGRHLLSLVDDLLDLSRLEAGKLEIRIHDCSLVDIFNDVEAITEPLRRRETVECRLVYETPVPGRIRTDCTRLTQAVINLLSNALKFTEKGYVRLRVRVEREAPEPRLTIMVEDSGVGIRPEDQERIFDSFTQVEPISRGATAGIGLGLPITKWIAEKLGGTLEVQSEYGRGSTFILRVATGPLDGVSWIAPSAGSGWTSAPLPQAPDSDRGQAGRAAPCRMQGRVLLADDAGDIRELIALALRRCGADVVTVENGRLAVEAATRDTFDLILMDVRMPELDGLSAAAELRRRGCRSTIIALTASTSDRQRERILTSGFDDFWAKPIPLADLTRRAAMYLPSPDERDLRQPIQGRLGYDRIGANGGERGLSTGERMASLVAEFVESLPERAGAIRKAVEGGDLSRARELLHQLVGTSGIHGFPSLSNEAAKLMKLVKDGAIAIGPAELRPLDEIIVSLQSHDPQTARTSAAQPGKP